MIGFKKYLVAILVLICFIQFNTKEALALDNACTTTGYAAAYDICSSTNPANQSSTTVTSSRAVQAAVTQTAGLVASRVASFTSSSSAPMQAWKSPDQHYKALALGRGGKMLNSTRTTDGTMEVDGSISDRAANDAVGDGLAAGSAPSKFGVWIDAAYSRLIFSKTDEHFDGNIATGMVGADYVVQKNLLVGLAGGYEQLDIDTQFNRGSVKGTGWTVSPYAAYKINETLSTDISGGYTWINYDLERLDPGNSAKITGEQNANRWFVSANLNSDHWINKFHVAGRVGVLHSKEDRDQFTESNLTSQAGASTNVGMGFVGVRLGYLLQFNSDSSIEPYMDLLGRAAYDDGGSGDSTDGVVGLGAAMTFGNLQVGFSGSSVVGRKDTENFTGKLNAQLNF